MHISESTNFLGKTGFKGLRLHNECLVLMIYSLVTPLNHPRNGVIKARYWPVAAGQKLNFVNV
jgi:hypothetical protein